jgi:hypothetical protein
MYWLAGSRATHTAAGFCSKTPDRSMPGASPAASCGGGAGRKCLLIVSGQRPKDVVRMSQKLVDAYFDDFDGQDVSPGSGA